MEVGDREAEAGRGLEAAGRGVHSDCWGCEGVVWGEDQGAPVLAVVVRCLWGAGEDVMPPAKC